MGCLKIVLFEPDHTYRSNICSFLQSHGCIVSIAETFSDIDKQAHNPEWVIYLLNLQTIPDWGIAFLASSESRRHCPVLALSDNDDHIDRIVTLEVGADDYIVKTTHHREILARIRVAQRRGRLARQPDMPARPTIIAKAPPGWCFSPEIRELVSPESGRIDLTTDQFNLLDLLIQNTGRTLSREYLSRALFDRDLKTTDRAIDNLVVRLRRRLGESARRPRIIKTARTGGYFFDGFPPPSESTPASFPLDQSLAA